MTVSDVDGSKLSAVVAATSRQKCATIVEEAEVDDLDGDPDNNGRVGTEGRKKS